MRLEGSPLDVWPKSEWFFSHENFFKPAGFDGFIPHKMRPFISRHFLWRLSFFRIGKKKYSIQHFLNECQCWILRALFSYLHWMMSTFIKYATIIVKFQLICHSIEAVQHSWYIACPGTHFTNIYSYLFQPCAAHALTNDMVFSVFDRRSLRWTNKPHGPMRILSIQESSACLMMAILIFFFFLFWKPENSKFEIRVNTPAQLE